MEQIKFSIKLIKEIRKALKDDAAGNSKCTMTDLDFACNMLDELVLIKNQINKLSLLSQKRSKFSGAKIY